MPNLDEAMYHMLFHNARWTLDMSCSVFGRPAETIHCWAKAQHSEILLHSVCTAESKIALSSFITDVGLGPDSVLTLHDYISASGGILLSHFGKLQPYWTGKATCSILVSLVLSNWITATAASVDHGPWTVSLFRALQLKINSDGKKIERAFEAWGGTSLATCEIWHWLQKWYLWQSLTSVAPHSNCASKSQRDHNCLLCTSKITVPPFFSRVTFVHSKSGEQWTREPFASESTSRLKKVNPWLPFSSACSYLFSAWMFWGAATDHSMLLFYFDFPSVISYLLPSCSLSLSLSSSFFVFFAYNYMHMDTEHSLAITMQLVYQTYMPLARYKWTGHLDRKT